MLPHLLRRFWWLTINRDVAEYVRSCSVCAARAPANPRARAPLRHRTSPTKPFVTGETDIKGPLSSTPEGFQYIYLSHSGCVFEVCGVYPVTSCYDTGGLWRSIKLHREIWYSFDTIHWWIRDIVVLVMDSPNFVVNSGFDIPARLRIIPKLMAPWNP